MIHQHTRSRRIADVSLAVLFVSMLCIPLGWNVFSPCQESGESEQRGLAPWPDLKLTPESLLLFPADCDAFFNDHFGLRTTLIHWLDHIEVLWLKSSSSDTVIVGKKGWFFLTESPVTKGCQPSHPFTAGQLRRWQQVLEARRDWLARRGIRYLVVFVPEKQTIYPEDLPRRYRPLQTRGTRLDQLMTYLHAHTDVPFLDLREPLRQAKPQERLYHYTDAHWNDRGAYVGYRRIVETLASWFTGMEPWPRSAFYDEVQREPGGDCVRMLALDHEITEEILKLTPKPEYPRLTHGTHEGFAPPVSGMAPPFAMYQDNSRLPRAVMFCDSFTAAMYPFLAQHFQRIAFIGQCFPTFDPALVEREQPDIVIQEMVERKLQYPELVTQLLIAVIPDDRTPEPADYLCRTPWTWSAFLRAWE